MAVIVSPSNSAPRALALSVSSRRYGSAMRQSLRCRGDGGVLYAAGGLSDRHEVVNVGAFQAVVAAVVLE